MNEEPLDKPILNAILGAVMDLAHWVGCTVMLVAYLDMLDSRFTWFILLIFGVVYALVLALNININISRYTKISQKRFDEIQDIKLFDEWE